MNSREHRRRHIGRRVLTFASTDSTNNRALEFAGDPGHHGLAILAHEQTAGRGRMGRSWYSPPGRSLLLSVLVFPPPQWCRPVLLTAWAAVSVAHLIHDLTGIKARIKWPNDVLVHDQKICGILLEQSTGSSGDNRQHLQGVIAGIGLNLLQTPQELKAQGLDQATSLCQHITKPLEEKLLSPVEVANTLLDILDREYDQLVQGNKNDLESAWRDYLDAQGRDVCVQAGGETIRGRLRHLGFDVLVIEPPGQPILQVLPERIQQVQLTGSGGS